jgi:RES domain-containing protein
MPSIWRIAAITPSYSADDLSGAGAKATGGRWNRKGNAVMYCASTISLACLETVVHLAAGGLPLNRYLVEIVVPDNIWKARKIMTHTNAPIGWDALPAGVVSLDTGDSWLWSLSSALFEVPSIVVPEEQNVLMNPMHPDASRIKARICRKWLYDSRLV